jgi:hypothetical protein
MRLVLLVALIGILVGVYFSMQERPVYEPYSVYNVQYGASLKVTEALSKGVRLQPTVNTQQTQQVQSTPRVQQTTQPRSLQFTAPVSDMYEGSL